MCFPPFLKFLSTSFFHFLPSSPELLRSAGKYELEHNQWRSGRKVILNYMIVSLPQNVCQKLKGV